MKEVTANALREQLFQNEMEQLNKATFEMLKKSDRVRVILLGSEVDRILRLLLREYLVPKDQKRDSLLEQTATFSTRIELGFRVGLLKPDWTHDLRIINVIRDEFAHGGSGLHLELPKFRDLCSQLKLGQLWIERGKYVGKEGDNAPTRFVATCVQLSAHFCVAGMNLKPLVVVWHQFADDAVSMVSPEETSL